MIIPVHNSLKQVLSEWVKHLHGHLLWMAFLHEDRIQEVIYNSDQKQRNIGAPPLLTKVSRIALQLSSAVCGDGMSQIVIILDHIQYVCFCQGNTLRFVMALNESAILESVWPGLGACPQSVENRLSVSAGLA